MVEKRTLARRSLWQPTLQSTVSCSLFDPFKKTYMPNILMPVWTGIVGFQDVAGARGILLTDDQPRAADEVQVGLHTAAIVEADERWNTGAFQQHAAELGQPRGWYKPGFPPCRPRLPLA
jgi:hypothetical protein